MQDLLQKLGQLQIQGGKEQIIQRFRTHVKGKDIVVGGATNPRHRGREGHWLETAMGVKHNSNNAPDLYGYEMKKESPVISFGDYSASEYIFSKKKDSINAFNHWQDDEVQMTRSDFLKLFGKPNQKRNGRYAWSGECVPRMHEWNRFGQKMDIDANKDILVYYSFENDARDDKARMPTFLQTSAFILIAIWKNDKMRQHIDNKFNQRGFFLCKKLDAKYSKICFGKPFNYERFLEGLQNGCIIFDSGMYEGNTRNYSMFRSKNKEFWNALITEEFE